MAEDEIMSEGTPVEEPQTGSEDIVEPNLDDELSRIYDESETQEVEAPKEEPQAKTPPPAEEIPAPHTWGKDTQELFKQLSPDLQKQIVKRETERENVVRQAFGAMNFAKNFAPMGQALSELEGYFRSFAKPDGQPLWGDIEAMAKEIKDVLAVKQLLLRDPQAGLHVVQQWAQRAGWKPQEGEEKPDPNTLDMRARLAQLEQQDVQRRAQAVQMAQQQRQQQAVGMIANHIQGLGDSKNDQGQFNYPHLHGEHAEKVGQVMGQWLRANLGQQGVTPELFKSAYETAIFSVPETREAEFKMREDTRIAQAKQKSAAAQKAAGIHPSTNRPPAGENVTTLEQDMEAIWAKYST